MSFSVFFETYGCQMNVSDTERARSLVSGAGLALAESAETADFVMLNTCSVRAKAERKVQARVFELKRNRSRRPVQVGVMGCVAQLEGESLLDAEGKVSLVAGTGAVERLPTLIKQAYVSARRVVDLSPRVEERSSEVPAAFRHSPCVAFVPIIEGCNKFCTYCIVPYARGRERSRRPVDIIQEVLKLREAGVREVHLIGQNVNSYYCASDNISTSKGATHFSKLLRLVAETGIDRVKFTTSFPRDFHLDIVQAIEEYPNLCNWIHLPVQSGSNKILRAMRRGYTRAEYLSKVSAIHQASVDFSLTTDFIVGYPGETRQDFNDTLALLEECRFDSSYIFKFSPRAGTPAALLSSVPHKEEVDERFQLLTDLQYRIQKEKMSAYIGKVVDVLIEGTSKHSQAEFTGHTTCHKVVNFPMGSGYSVGDIASVAISGVKANSLAGRLAHE